MQRMPEVFTSLFIPLTVPLINPRSRKLVGCHGLDTILTRCLGGSFVDELLRLQSLLISCTVDRPGHQHPLPTSAL